MRVLARWTRKLPYKNPGFWTPESRPRVRPSGDRKEDRSLLPGRLRRGAYGPFGPHLERSC